MGHRPVHWPVLSPVKSVRYCQVWRHHWLGKPHLSLNNPSSVNCSVTREINAVYSRQAGTPAPVRLIHEQAILETKGQRQCHRKMTDVPASANQTETLTAAAATAADAAAAARSWQGVQKGFAAACPHLRRPPGASSRQPPGQHATVRIITNAQYPRFKLLNNVISILRTKYADGCLSQCLHLHGA